MESVGDTGAGEVVQREGRWRWRLVRGDRGRREKKEDEEVVEDTAGQGRGGKLVSRMAMAMAESMS